MINYDTIISNFDDKVTLYNWLRKVEEALKNASATNFVVNKKGNATLSFSITFADGETLESGDIVCAANALLILCARVNSMITKYLENRLATFKQTGGFDENMTKERIETQRQQSEEEGAPRCPKCGATMVKRYAKRGSNQGKAFWSCSKYSETGCTGSRSILNQ